MIYSILKDDDPTQTTKRIRDIITQLNIKIEEKIFNYGNDDLPISIRLTIKGTNIGVNGKGTNIVNAKASAYAEFMERLQNFYLFDINNNVINILKQQNNTNNFFYENNFTKKINIHKKLKKRLTNKELVFIPYYNIKDGKTYNLPFNIIIQEKGSNGMAAGNTLEEAFVQGFSEICERYAIKEIFNKNISIPDIPKEYYLKYKNIKKIISNIETYGYKIHIKDASLDGKIPVVCTIIENINKNTINFSFGAQPSLPVAIERTLTEFLQGISIAEFKENPYICPYYTKTKLKYIKKELLIQSLVSLKISIEKNSEVSNLFFKEDTNYKFNQNAWISEKDEHSNKSLLTFLIRKIEKITNNIFVRDASFLGFPSIDIFIPEISELFVYNKKTIESFILDKEWGNFSTDKLKDTNTYNINNLLKLAETFAFLEKSPCYSKNIFCVPFEYIAFLSAIALRKKSKIIKYARIIIEQNKHENIFNKNQIQLIKIIKDYNQSYKTNKFFKKYKKDLIEEANYIIKNLTFEDILDIVINPKINVNKKIPQSIIKSIEKEYKKHHRQNSELQHFFENIEPIKSK